MNEDIGKVFPAKDLLDRFSSPLNSTSLFNAMILAGLAEEKKYISSTGSGEVKSYLSLTKSGLQYGVNRQSNYSEKTELRFYANSFKTLLVQASEAILKHSTLLT